MIRKTTIFFLFLALLAIAHADPENTSKDGNGGGEKSTTITTTTLAPVPTPPAEPGSEAKATVPESNADQKTSNNTASAAQYAFGASLVLLATL